MTATTCPACTSLHKIHPNLDCNHHRAESIASGLVRKARAAGHVVADGDWKAAEAALSARPVVIG